MLSYVQAQCYPSFVQVPHSDSGDLRYGICRVRANSIIIIIIIIIIVNPLTARVVGAPQMILWNSIADSNPDLRSIVVSILRISCTDHVTDEEVRAKIQQAIGLQEDLLTIVFGSPAQLVTKRQNNACFATSVISMSIALVLSKAATTPVQKTTNTCDV